MFIFYLFNILNINVSIKIILFILALIILFIVYLISIIKFLLKKDLFYDKFLKVNILSTIKVDKNVIEEVCFEPIGFDENMNAMYRPCNVKIGFYLCEEAVV